MTRLSWMVALAVSTTSAVSGLAQDDDREAGAARSGVLKYKLKNIDGDEVDLAKYQGKVLLIVNVASECGLTPQYQGLQELYEKYSGDGLAVLGFPCNQFGNQEPGTEADIKTFCQSKYDVSFDMFSKIDVNGEQRAELYSFLTGVDTQPQEAGDISWNFEKFLIDRDGEVVARFSPRTKPTDKELVAAIEKALAESSTAGTNGK